MNRSSALFTLFRYPAGNSLSPKLHQYFASLFQLSIVYDIRVVNQQDFPQALRDFRSEGGMGANITQPLKELAYTLCDKTSQRARIAQAVNTIYWDKQNNLCGDNTDGVGLVRDLSTQYHQTLTDKTILIIGAGGAAAGIIPSLLAQNPEKIYISNRNKARALDLAQRFESQIEVINLEAIDGVACDIVINATPVNMPNSLLNKKCFLYDLSYHNIYPLDVVVHNGLGMLIEQAAESFYIWHGLRPNTALTQLFLSKIKK